MSKPFSDEELLSAVAQALARSAEHWQQRRRVRASQHFRSFWGAWRTTAGYEAINVIRKGQARWSAVGAKVGLLHRFTVAMFGSEA